MTAPANIRVNISAPFPALVTGTGPVTITKINGIWTVGFSINQLTSQIPLVGAYPTDFLIVYDSVAGNFFKLSITNLLSSIALVSGAARTQRSVTATPIVVQSTDQIINCNIASPAACTLPAASTRVGVPLTFKDLGQAGANNITITAAGGDNIDGSGTYVIRNNRAAVTLVPFNDGTNTGWAVE